MARPDDADLVAGFVAGDERAVRGLYERYAGPVLTVTASILDKRELAEEALHTTMLNAWRASATFDIRRPLAPWLYAIARRAAVDVLRRESRAAVPAPVDDDAVAVSSPSFEATWEAWEIRSALAQLPAVERDVVRLAHLVGMTHAEIATHLGLPLGTVKSRSARAHRRLAGLLGHVAAGEEEGS